jgi:hypothetical protein
MAADWTFDPGIVIDDDTLQPQANLTGTFTLTVGGATQTVYDINGSVIGSLSSNQYGYVNRFRADSPTGFINFGVVAQPVVAFEVFDNAADISAHLAASQAAQTSAAASAASAASSASAVSAMQADVDSRLSRTLTKRVITGAYTLVAEDAVDMVMHSTSALALIIALPSDANAGIGQEIPIPWRQYGAGQITFANGPGAALISRGSAFKSAGQYAEGEFTKVAANTWLLSGDITT